MILGDVKKKNIPDVPGVYFFKKGKKILYIGKATSLSSRVRSYFQKELIEARSPLIEKMVEEADDVVWEETGSALEALIREAKLIKKYQPLYNTKEKDNKSFNYVVITKEPFPRLVVIRERELLNKKEALQDITIAHEFGPFTQGKSLNQALSIIRKIFPFRDRKSDNKQYEVFYKQIGLLPDTTKKNAQKAYNKTIENIVLLFEGNIEKLTTKLEKEMHQAAREERFEEAGKIKKQLFSLTHIKDVALVDDSFVRSAIQEELYRIEAYDIAHTAGKDVVGVMVVIQNGVPQKNEYRMFTIKDNPGINDTKALKEIVSRRLEHAEWQYPRLIVVDGGKAQKRAVEDVLEESGVHIPVVSVVKNEKHQPRNILGTTAQEKEVLLANAEAHRFAIQFHRKKRAQSMFSTNS